MNDKAPDNCPKCGAKKIGGGLTRSGYRWKGYKCGYAILSEDTACFDPHDAESVARELHDKLAVEREAREMAETENRLLRRFIKCLQCGSILLDTELDAWLSVPIAYGGSP